MQIERRKEYRTSLGFPAHHDETIIIRDGRGRTVEAWTVTGIFTSKDHKFVEFHQVGYRDSGAL